MWIYRGFSPFVTQEKAHQIRVAFSHIGHPLVGDTLYGAQPTGQPFQLRAQKVVFIHMRTGERITVTA